MFSPTICILQVCGVSVSWRTSLMGWWVNSTQAFDLFSSSFLFLWKNRALLFSDVKNKQMTWYSEFLLVWRSCFILSLIITPSNFILSWKMWRLHKTHSLTAYCTFSTRSQSCMMKTLLYKQQNGCRVPVRLENSAEHFSKRVGWLVEGIILFLLCNSGHYSLQDMVVCWTFSVKSFCNEDYDSVASV